MHVAHFAARELCAVGEWLSAWFIVAVVVVVIGCWVSVWMWGWFFSLLFVFCSMVLAKSKTIRIFLHPRLWKLLTRARTWTNGVGLCMAAGWQVKSSGMRSRRGYFAVVCCVCMGNHFETHMVNETLFPIQPASRVYDAKLNGRGILYRRTSNLFRFEFVVIFFWLKHQPSHLFPTAVAFLPC